MSANLHTPIVAGVDADAATFNSPLGQLDSAFSGFLAGNTSLPQLNLTDGAALTVTANAVLIANSIHTIYTGGGHVILNNINGFATGDILVLGVSDSTNSVTITTAGNILTRSGQSVIMRNIREYMIFVYKGGKWNEIGSSPLEFWSMGGSSPYSPGGLYISPGMLSNPTNRLPRLEATPNYAARNWWAVKANAAVLIPVGIGAMTTAGTLSEASNANTTYVNFLSGAVIGNAAGLNSTTYNHVHIENSPDWLCVLETVAGTDIANIRIWAGLCSAAVTNIDDLVAGTKAVIMRYSTVTGDAGWQGIVDDGASMNSTGTGSSITANTQYLLRIRVDWASQLAYFSVNNGTEYGVSVSALSGTKLGFVVILYTTASAAKNILISRIYCEYK